MNRSASVTDRLREYFAKESPASGPIGADTPLLESGILDSLAIIKLLTFIEDQFSVEVTDEEFDPENFASVAAIAALIAAKLGD